jgi:hypothetical protein
MENVEMPDKDIIGIDEFLCNNSDMVLVPCRTRDVIIKGIFRFYAAPSGGIDIEDSYNLKIVVPHIFPRALPKVFELDEKIKREPDYHVNEDGSLCLGSPVRLLKYIAEQPTLQLFGQKLLVPYLYAISHHFRVGGKLLFGELAHGIPGILQDYSLIFQLQTLKQIKEALIYLGLRKRIANKKPCPCGCGLLLGKCKHHYILNKYRYLASRNWFNEQAIKIK